MLQAYRQHVRENLWLALDTLRTHKFRSFLTVLGVLIGTTTVIAVTSIIAGLDKQLVDVAEQFGTRTLWVYKLQLGAPHAMTREERLPYLEIGRARGCDVEAVFFDVPLEVCLERNARRHRIVPADALAKMAAKLVPPTTAEGFDRVTVVS